MATLGTNATSPALSFVFGFEPVAMVPYGIRVTTVIVYDAGGSAPPATTPTTTTVTTAPPTTPTTAPPTTPSTCWAEYVGPIPCGPGPGGPGRRHAVAGTSRSPTPRRRLRRSGCR